MTRRPFLCSFCALPTEAIAQRRDKRSRQMVNVCARHRDKTEPLTPRQRGIVARRMVQIAGGG